MHRTQMNVQMASIIHYLGAEDPEITQQWESHHIPDPPP